MGSILLLLLQSALQPLWVWPAQLTLSILSRKVFKECRCQQHVKPPTWRTSNLERFNSLYQVSPASETTWANSSSGRWNYRREIAENFAENGYFHFTFGFFFTCRKLRHRTDGFTSPPMEGALRIFSPEKSDGFGRVLNSRTWVPEASTLTSRPPKLLSGFNCRHKLN